MSKRILVTMATGNQGGGLVRALAKRNKEAASATEGNASPYPYTILAVTRSASSSKAKALAALPGVELIESDYEVKSIFDKATQGGTKDVHGVFGVQSAMLLPSHVSKGPAGETELGVQLIDEAKRRNVKQFVYTSVDFGGLPKTDIPHFESKRLIEEHLKKQGGELQWTILQPVAFMDNFSNGEAMFGRIMNTFFTSVLKKPIKLIAATDIGEFAALVFEQPDKYQGKSIPLAGDELDPQGIQKAYEDVKGKKFPTTFGIFPSILLLLSKEMSTMFRFFNKTGFEANVKEVRALHPNLKTFRQFIETEM